MECFTCELEFTATFLNQNIRSKSPLSHSWLSQCRNQHKYHSVERMWSELGNRSQNLHSSPLPLTHSPQANGFPSFHFAPKSEQKNVSFAVFLGEWLWLTCKKPLLQFGCTNKVKMVLKIAFLLLLFLVGERGS